MSSSPVSDRETPCQSGSEEPVRSPTAGSREVRVGFIVKRLAKAAVVFQTAVVGARGIEPRNIESPLPPLFTGESRAAHRGRRLCDEDFFISTMMAPLGCRG